MENGTGELGHEVLTVLSRSSVNALKFDIKVEIRKLNKTPKHLGFLEKIIKTYFQWFRLKVVADPYFNGDRNISCSRENLLTFE